MGKIFDALEKSENNKGLRVLATPGSLSREVGCQETVASFSGNGSRAKEIHDRPITGQYRERYDYDPVKLDPNLVTWFKPQTIESEQFRILKNRLLFPTEGNAPRVVMVISPEPDDGKSFVSANLSITMAESMDDHVLLMDCDIRSTNIHAMFGYGELPGLREFLENKAPLSTLFYNTMVEKLKILPGGAPHPSPSDLLSSSRMANLIQEVKARYNDRYIIMDMPPPRMTAEANALAQQVDGILVVVKHGKTPRKAAKQLVAMFDRDKIIGVVSNGFVPGPGYGYGGHYGYF